MADQEEVRELLTKAKEDLSYSANEEIFNYESRKFFALRSIAYSLLAIASVVADMEFADEE